MVMSTAWRPSWSPCPRCVTGSVAPRHQRGTHSLLCNAVARAQLKQPFPFHWLPPVQLGMPFLISCKLAAMQFVVLKPLTTFVAVLLETQGAYDHGTFRPDRYVCAATMATPGCA